MRVEDTSVVLFRQEACQHGRLGVRRIGELYQLGSIIKQLLQLFATRLAAQGKLPMSIVTSTQQTNWNDCGVYAAAYATEVLFLVAPESPNCRLHTTWRQCLRI